MEGSDRAVTEGCRRERERDPDRDHGRDGDVGEEAKGNRDAHAVRFSCRLHATRRTSAAKRVAVAEDAD